MTMKFMMELLLKRKHISTAVKKMKIKEKKEKNKKRKNKQNKKKEKYKKEEKCIIRRQDKLLIIMH